MCSQEHGGRKQDGTPFVHGVVVETVADLGQILHFRSQQGKVPHADKPVENPLLYFDCGFIGGGCRGCQCFCMRILPGAACNSRSRDAEETAQSIHRLPMAREVCCRRGLGVKGRCTGGHVGRKDGRRHLWGQSERLVCDMQGAEADSLSLFLCSHCCHTVRGNALPAPGKRFHRARLRDADMIPPHRLETATVPPHAHPTSCPSQAHIRRPANTFHAQRAQGSRRLAIPASRGARPRASTQSESATPGCGPEQDQ